MAATPESRPGRGTARRFPLWIPALIAVVVLAAGAYAVLGGDDDAPLATGASQGTSEGATSPDPSAGASGEQVAVADVEITGADLPPYDSAADDEAIGRTFPAISGTGVLRGDAISIPNDDGRAKLVLFLAHWCPHCQAEVPVVRDWFERQGPDDVDVYAVSTAVAPDRGNYPPADWLARENWTFPTIADDEFSSALAAAGGTGFPFFVAVDAEGKVVQRASGELSEAKLAGLVSQLQP